MDGDHQVLVKPLRDESEKWGLESGAITSDLQHLATLDLVYCFESVAGINNVFIKQPGLDVVKEWQEVRSNPRRRAQEIRDALLNWLYDEHVGGGHVAGISDFLDSSMNHFMGDPYSESELARAAKWLMEEEYIDGFKTMGAELLRPSITTKGMRVIETEQSVNTALSSAGVNVTEVNISGSSGVNVAVASNNVNQSNTLTQGQIEEIERILGSVRAMLNPTVIGVTEEVHAEAQVVVAQLEEEIQSPAPKTGIVKSLIIKLMEQAATGTLQGGVDALNSMMQQGIAGM